MSLEEREFLDLINSKKDMEEIERIFKELKKGKPRDYVRILRQHTREVTRCKVWEGLRGMTDYMLKEFKIKRYGMISLISTFFSWIPCLALGEILCKLQNIPYSSPLGILIQALSGGIPFSVSGYLTLYYKRKLEECGEKTNAYRREFREASRFLESLKKFKSY
ncbi:MAG: hypothetical protein DRP00_00305 [Candidatus Aenigmatarchaeota archaeon]|nr:MAG: hypothetical protein DRP00_00305 [Candidatus Aenigmarchaeota archaeon]